VLIPVLLTPTLPNGCCKLLELPLELLRRGTMPMHGERVRSMQKSRRNSLANVKRSNKPLFRLTGRSKRQLLLRLLLLSPLSCLLARTVCSSSCGGRLRTFIRSLLCVSSRSVTYSESTRRILISSTGYVHWIFVLQSGKYHPGIAEPNVLRFHAACESLRFHCNTMWLT